MRLNDWKQKGQFLQIQNRNVFYVEEGGGETLLLLPAFPTASWGFHRMWPQLTKRFRTIAPDLPGLGFSDKPKGNHYSLSNLAEVVLKLLEQLEVNKLHILASAYGVSIAQELLARQLEKKELKKPLNLEFLSICFVGGAMFPEVAKTTKMQRFLLTPAGRAFANFFPTPFRLFQINFSSTFGPNSKPTKEELEEYWELLTFNEGHKCVPELIRYLTDRKQMRDRLVGAVLTTEVPLCLINSQTDELTGERINRRWEELLPNSLLIELKEPVGHYPTLELPGMVLDGFFEFLERKY